MAQTLPWYTGRITVATWKDVPQDAKDLVEWWSRLEALYGTGSQPPEPRWHPSLSELGGERLRQLGAKYGAQYAIAERTDPPLKLPMLYGNANYVVYRLR